MNNKLYNIDYTKAVQWLVPNWLRQTIMVNWLRALITPLVWLYQAFLRYRDAKNYELMITPQVCYLERMVNNRFDYTLRRIYISDGVWYDPLFVFQDAEDKPVYMVTDAEADPVYVYSESEAGQFADDFVVMVPNDIAFNMDELKALLNSYKLAGTRYTIKLF